MKKLYILVFLLLSLSLVMASQETLLNVHQNEITLLSNSDSGVEINFELGNLESKVVTTKGGSFVELSADEFSLTGEEGMPQLPYSQKLIAVPLGASVKAYVNIKSQNNLSLTNRGINYKVKPAQLSAEKCADAKEVPFNINENIYNTNSMISQKTVTVNEIGIMRGTRLFEVNFYPVSYNPVTGDINVINSADVTIEFDGADYYATEELKARTNSFMFEGVLSKTIFNYTRNRNSLDNYPLGYVIITPNMFLDTLEPFINWKKEQGYDVILATTENIGTSTSAIKNYMQGLWDDATADAPAPSYLLIVGDVQQVPAFTGTTESGHVTDLDYVKLQGNDFLPEMYYGRFSATNVSQLTPQVNKTLMYEKYEMSNPSYLERMTLIAGVDGSWAPTHGNGTLYYGGQNYFNDAHDLDVTSYPYPVSGSSASSIIADVNAGVGFLNYTAHGSETTWADPSMTISNINSMTNDEMYPVVVGNCCLTNHFNTSTCFGEAFLRATNGAVIYVGGTNSTYWDEDYWWSVGHFTPTSTATPTYAGTGFGTYDALFHENGEAFEDWAHTTGAWVFTGNMTVQASSSSRKNYYWEIYSIMGDPSLMPYMGIPEAQTPDYQETLLVGMTSFDITAAPYSYAALSMDGELLGTCLVDGSGNGTISFEALNTPGNAKLVLSHTDRQPYIADIEIVPAEGPYLVIESQQVTGFMTAGNDISMILNVKNVGVETVSDVTVTITAIDNATMTAGNATIATITADQSVAVNPAILFTLDNGLSKDENVTLNVNMQAGTRTWSYDLNFVTIAPEFNIASTTIEDNDNGILDPGDAANVNVNITNAGNYAASNLVATLTTTTPGITITTSEITVDAVEINATSELAFEVEVSEFIEVGITANFEVTFVSNNEVENSELFTAPVGLIFEDFETGDFSSNFNWGTSSWTVANSGAHDGTYCALSNDIADGANTSMSIQMDDVAEGEISFWLKVSSEATYDKLKFYIDGQEKDNWSGTVAWQETSFDVTAGDHTFKWTYVKDSSMSTGSDCAWIDDIVFPASVGNVGAPEISVDMLSHDFGSVNVATVDITVSSEGDAILAGQITGNEVFMVSTDGNEPTTSLAYSLDPAQDLTFTVHFMPTANISYSDVITITSNDSENAEINVTVNGIGLGVTNADNNVLPAITELRGNYPNPFNPETTVRYAVKETGKIKLKIFNIKGQLVKTLVNQEVKAGFHAIVWNGTDNFGTDVATGIYMYRLETKTYNQTKKMMLMK